MDLQVFYQIEFLNQNQIKGKVKVKRGEQVRSIKKRVIQVQGLKNQNSFKITNLQQSAKITQSTEEIIIKEHIQGSTLTQKSNSRKMSEDQMFEEASMIFENKQQEFIQNEPQIPPNVCGYVTFSNKFFFCFSSRRYIRLTSRQLSLFETQTSSNAEQTISFQQIKQIKSYKRKQYFCIRLSLEDRRLDMKFQRINVCKQWVGYINQNIKFNLFLKQKKQYSKTQSFQKFYQTFIDKHMQSTNIVKLEDSQLFQKSQSQQNTEKFVQSKQEWVYNSKEKSFHNQIVKLSEFQITHKIDSGSFSIVYLAEKTNKKGEKKLLALKQLNKDKLLYKNQMKYAITQLNILKRCRNCRYIIPLHYAFQTHQFLYLALQYIPYGNLGTYLKKKKMLNEQVAIKIIVELIVAIQYLHSLKILYRDLKLENILLNFDGHIFLTDYGLSKQLTAQQDHATSFLGTPLYLSPERFNGADGSVDYKSDIYGVGCIFYQLIHGKHPFYAEDYSSVVYNIRNCQPEINKQVSAQAKKFIYQTLQKNPQKRLSSMRRHQLFEKVDWNKVQKKKQKGIDFYIILQKPKVQISYSVDEDYNEQNFPDKKIVNWNFNGQS